MEQYHQSVYPGAKQGFLASVTGGWKAYFLVTKPTSVLLLVFTGLVGYAVASQGDFQPVSFLALLLALTLGCAGANTLTCYVDRDIDAVMTRTRHRPIPSSQLSPSRALVFGLVLTLLALELALYLSLAVFLVILAGVLNNVVIYSLWAKRRTSLNIFAGSIAGGLPAIAGYMAYAGAIDVEGLFLGGIVMVWIPVHVWSIALKYKDDYLAAHVPLLPAVVKEARAAQLIALLSALSVVLSVVPPALGLFGTVYLYTAIVLGLGLFSLSLWLMFRPTGVRAMVVFKASSLYLGLLFLSVLIDSML